MGQKFTTAASGVDVTSRRQYADRLGALRPENLESFADLTDEDTPPAETAATPADENLEELWEERTPPAERYADTVDDAATETTDDTPEPLSAAERARTRGVSELRAEPVETPTADELTSDTPPDDAPIDPDISVGDDVADLLGVESEPAPDDGTPPDSDTETTASPTLTQLDPDADRSSPERDDVAQVQDVPQERNTPALRDSEVTAEGPDAPADPDGYWEAYTGVDTEETPTEGDTTRDITDITDVTGDGTREVTGPQNDRPPLNPDPEGSDDNRQRLGTPDAGTTDPDAGVDTAPTDDAVQPGNLSQDAAYQHEREASRPTSFDIEYGASAKANNTPTWDDDDNTAAASGGIPIGPDDNDAASYADLDEDLWHKPTTVTEMQEQYLLAEQEIADQRTQLEQDYDVSFELGIDPSNDAETTPSRRAAVQEAGDAVATAAQQQQAELERADIGWNGPRWGDQSPHNRTRQQRMSRDERWDEYEPETETRTIMGESVDVATDPAPYEPVAGSNYRYPDTRADRVYQSLPDSYQSNVDRVVSDLSETVSTADQTRVKREFMRSLEHQLGTVRANDIDAVKLRVEAEGSRLPLLDARDTTRQELLTTKTKTFDTGYKDLFTTTGTVDVDDFDDVIEYQQEDGYWRDNNFHERRSSVRGVVRHVESVAERHKGRPTDADQIFYVTDPTTDELKDVKVTVWESGLHTEQRAASNNAERDATGRTIDQTEDIPQVEPGDPVLLSDIRPQRVRGVNTGTHTTSDDMLVAQVDDTATVTRLDLTDDDWAAEIDIPDHLSPREESVREQLTSYTDGVPSQTRRGTGL